MDKLDAMRTFARVVSSGGFAEAARQLGLTRSAVSKAVMQLEHLLGARLLDRTTRMVAPTEVGLAYYERCVAIIAEVEEVEARIAGQHEAPRGVLRVNGPMSFGTSHLGPAIAAFLARYPGLRIELTLDDRFVDPIAEGFDVTVRIGELADSSLVARRIAPVRRLLVAAPDYLERHGVPARPADLASHACLGYGQLGRPHRWVLREGGGSITIPIRPSLCANNGEVLREAAMRGLGIAVLPLFIVAAELRSGVLVPVLPEHAPQELAIHALYAPNRYLAAKTRVFIDFLVERFSDEVWEG